MVHFFSKLIKIDGPVRKLKPTGGTIFLTKGGDIYRIGARVEDNDLILSNLNINGIQLEMLTSLEQHKKALMNFTNPGNYYVDMPIYDLAILDQGSYKLVAYEYIYFNDWGGKKSKKIDYDGNLFLDIKGGEVLYIGEIELNSQSKINKY